METVTDECQVIAGQTIGTHLCWAQLEIGGHIIQIINCYMEPGQQQELKDRTRRVVEITKDITKQDLHAPIVVCGDFNNHFFEVGVALGHSKFSAAIESGTETHRQRGDLDQVFTLSIEVVNAVVSSGYDNDI